MIAGGGLRSGLRRFVALAAVLLLAGCSGDPTPAPSLAIATGTTTAPSVGVSTSPSVSVAPTPVPRPTLPAAATKQTADGAKAFGRYWIDLYNYAYATGDSAPIAALTDPHCVYCKSVVAIVDHDRQANLRRIGGTVRIRSIEAVQISGDLYEGFLVQVALSQDAIRTIYPDGKVFSSDAANPLLRDDIRVVWDSGFRVYAERVTRPGQSS